MPQAIQIKDWFAERDDIRAGFLDRTGWSNAAVTPVGEDCSSRRFFRLERGRETAVLMESAPDGSEMATPGHRIADYIRISRFLRSIGLHAPAVYEADEKAGYLLIEDCGDVSFKAALADGADRAELYEVATDVLIRLRQCAAPGTNAMALPDYYDDYIHRCRTRVVDYYIPVVRRTKNPDGLLESYRAVWNSIEKSLPPVPRGFLHADYHFENMMWMTDADKGGLDRCGILDFQGAMAGPLPYDLVNLLEDARVRVPDEIRTAMINRYCAGMSTQEREIFENWYRVLGTQFHCRVIGLFVRLAAYEGKARYLEHLPRLAAYLKEGLEHPVLKPLKEWFGEQDFSFDAVPDIDPDEVRSFIRSDAF